jgi:hypothetical protein
VLSITIISDDTTIWSITYNCHYDDRNSFIIQATGECQSFESQHPGPILTPGGRNWQLIFLSRSVNIFQEQISLCL